MERKCTVCGRPVLGRADKIYCSDECRTASHNLKNKDEGELVKKVNRTLRKNRKILKELNPKTTAVVSRQRLIDAGFSFTYYTNTYQTKKGKMYFFVYEQGYLILENDDIALVSRHDYVE